MIAGGTIGERVWIAWCYRMQFPNNNLKKEQLLHNIIAIPDGSLAYLVDADASEVLLQQFES